MTVNYLRAIGFANDVGEMKRKKKQGTSAKNFPWKSTVKFKNRKIA